MLILVPKIFSQINFVQNTKFPKKNVGPKLFCPKDADLNACQKNYISMKNLE